MIILRTRENCLILQQNSKCQTVKSCRGGATFRFLPLLIWALVFFNQWIFERAIYNPLNCIIMQINVCYIVIFYILPSVKLQ